MMNQQDNNFLREYHFFTSGHIPTIARVIATRMRQVRADLAVADSREDNLSLGGELGHLLAHLYMLNFMQVEAISALLYALVHPKGGILRALLAFDIKKHSDFVDRLREEKVTLADMGIHVPSELRTTKEHDHASAQLNEHLRRFAAILRDDNLRRTYNKLKHGAIVVRRPEFLWADEDTSGLETDAVFVPIPKSPTDLPAMRLPLSSEVGQMPPEDQYLANVEYIGRMAAVFAKAAGQSQQS